MKRNKFPFLLSVFLLVSCQTSNVEHPIDDYRSTLSFSSDTFNIMHLTDVHWTFVTKLEESKKYMQDLFDDAKKEQGHIDLVTITGDVFLNANKYIVEELFSFLSGWEVPIAIVYGNHDKEGEWSLSWMNKMISTSKNFIAKINDNDNVYGDTNYFIDIKDGNDLSWRIYMMDSNSLQPGNAIKYQYDYIHEDQVDWMKRVNNDSSKEVPSLGFIHIPPKEFGTAVADAKKDSSKHLLGEQNETSCPAKTDSSFFKVAKEINMKGIFFGHDHANDIVTMYDDVVLGYGVKSNIELYYYKDNNDFTHTGYAVYNLKKDSSWTIQHVYMNYTNHSQIIRSDVWRS